MINFYYDSGEERAEDVRIIKDTICRYVRLHRLFRFSSFTDVEWTFPHSKQLVDDAASDGLNTAESELEVRMQHQPLPPTIVIRKLNVCKTSMSG